MSKIFFYHINKCAGTSLLSHFLALTSAHRNIRIENYLLSDGGLDKSFIDEIFRAEFIHDPAGMVNWRAIFGNGFNILWLRDPVERLISQIQMIARWTDKEVVDPSHINFKLRSLAQEGIESFLTSDNFAAHQNSYNGITSYLQLNDSRAKALWNSHYLLGCTFLNNLAMEIALHNLSEMDFIGFVDSFDEDISDLNATLGLIYPKSIPKLNFNPKHRQEITSVEMSLLNNAVHIDKQVYDYAKKLSAEKKKSPIFLEAYSGVNIKQIKKIKGPVDSIIIDASEPSFIEGWHPTEINNKLFSRWSGVGEHTLIATHIEKNRDLYFRFRVIDINNPCIINELEILFDGLSVKFNIDILSNGNLVISGFIPFGSLNLNDDILWINMNYGRNLASKFANDERNLGICVADLEIGPSEKYSNCQYKLLNF